MSLLKIALLQLAQERPTEGYLEKGLEFCRKAKLMGADIALFPEMWNIGYRFPKEAGECDTWKSEAIDQSDSFFARFRDLAKELDMAIAVTYLEKWGEHPRNTVSVIDRFGKCVLTYAKVHTCDFSSECLLTPGDDFMVCDLDTSKGIVRIGTMICYDREFPESARLLMLKGAEFILVPNACEMEDNRRMQLRTRAYENMVGIALANYAKGNCCGHSVAYDPIAFSDSTEAKDGSSRNTLVVEAGEEEGIHLACFDLEAIRRYRSREAWGNAYRKPKTYTMLISEEVSEPFKRHNARR